MKRCRDCGAVKPVDDFNLRNRHESATTRRPFCRACGSAMSVRYVKAHPESQRRYRTRTADRYALSAPARAKANYAIETGKLTRPNVCEACGRAAFTEAAHTDYSRPLDVMWLCRRCHRESDHAEPKTLRPAQPSRVAGLETLVLAGPDAREASAA